MSPKSLKILAGILALVNLGICLAAPVLYFLGLAAERSYRTSFLLSSIAWFIFASIWVTAGKKAPGR